MNIVLGIATMVMMAVVIYLNVRLNNHEADTNLEIEDLKTKYDYIKKLDESIDSDLDSAEMRITSNEDSIKEIVSKLEEITADIHRIDHDETEIRKYYINYRMPSHPNGGVPWAKDIKCNEETENE